MYYLWDNRPGRNVDHISHHMTKEFWEHLYEKAEGPILPDKGDASASVLQVRHGRVPYKLVFRIIEGDLIYPVEVFPITGFEDT